MPSRSMLVLTALLLLGCRHLPPNTGSHLENTFTLVLEDANGAVLGFDKLSGRIEDFAATSSMESTVLRVEIEDETARALTGEAINEILSEQKLQPVTVDGSIIIAEIQDFAVRAVLRDAINLLLKQRNLPSILEDRGVLVTGISDRAIRQKLQRSISAMLAEHHLPQISIDELIHDRHVSCHVAMNHHPSRGGGFGGPGLLECRDALLVGVTALNLEQPLWKQRGLLLRRDLYPDRMKFDPMPPVQHQSQTEITWDRAAHFLRAIPRQEGAGFFLCPTGNGVYPDINEQPELLQAARRALVRFVNELPGNRDLIMTRLGPEGFAVEKLDPVIQQHLLQLMREEVLVPSRPDEGDN